MTTGSLGGFLLAGLGLSFDAVGTTSQFHLLFERNRTPFTDAHTPRKA
jgi:hypothetical protein